MVNGPHNRTPATPIVTPKSGPLSPHPMGTSLPAGERTR